MGLQQRPFNDASAAQPPRLGVLLVEDNGAVSRFLQTLLPLHGFLVLTAGDRTQALDLLRNYRTAIAVALVDVRLGVGGDGFQVLAALRRLQPRLPCCLMSGDPSDGDPATLQACGASRFFGKPLNLTELVEELRRVATEQAIG